ncbi:hypothetical protein VFPYRCLA_072 [Candidatus Vidania fulgoroideae]|nr:hypothetical protein VFPYRCLA_072 [Candidatus Vidania fulgoroideae]
MYKKFIKKYIYITGKNLYDLVIYSLKFANFILEKNKVYNDNLFSDIYKNKERVVFITCGEKKVFFRRMIEKFTHFTKGEKVSNNIIGNKHFSFFKKKINEFEEEIIFIFLCVENFSSLFTSKIVNFMDKKNIKKKSLIFIGERKHNSRLSERCINLEYFKKEEVKRESFLEKEVSEFIKKKKKKKIYDLCKKYTSDSILNSLRNKLKLEVIVSKENSSKLIRTVELIDYALYNNFFENKEKLVVFLLEVFITINE